MTPLSSSNSDGQREAYQIALLAFLTSRLLSGIFVYLGHIQRINIFDNSIWEGVSNWWLNPWTAFDSIYYIAVAQNGYQFENHTTAFFPLYSLLLKLGGSHEQELAVAGVIISNLCFFISLYMLYRLTEMDFGSSVSKKAVWLLAFFPTSVFFSAVYSESVFLLLVLACFYAARRSRWGIAGVCGLMSALTRNPGALISVALALEYFRSLDYEFRRLRVLPLFFISLPLIGFIGVQAYLEYQVGIPMAGVASQQNFYRAPGWPWMAVWKDLVGFFTYLHYDLITFINLLVIFLTTFFILRFHRIIRPSYGIFMIGLILMNLIYYVRIPPHTTGTARYILTAFPFFQLLALSLERRKTRRFAYPMIGTYVYSCFIFSFLFGLKFFLG